jgi:AcrR family transcriptional regulator
MNKQAKSRTPITKPRQRRSAQTQEKILKVVDRHLVAGTFNEVTVQDLVSEAGCSVGAFYGRFTNKTAALYHFYDARCRELEKAAQELLDPDRPESLNVLLTDFTERVVRRTFAYAAILKVDALRVATDPDHPFTRRARELNSVLLDMMSKLLEARQAEFSHTASEETALFVLALVGGLSRDAVVTGARLADKTGEHSAERFIVDLTRAVHGFLGLRGQTDASVKHA